RSAGTAGPHRLAAAVPGAGPCGPGHRRSHGGAARDRAAGGRHRRGGDRAGGPGPGRVAVLRRADGHPRGGRLPGDTHVRVRGGGAGSDQCRRDDRRLGAPALRRLGAHLRAHHAGGARGEPGGLRHQRQAAGHHRVGVKGVKYTVVQTPRGAKDILPREAYVKSRLEQRAAAYLESWGYARVYTPTFEFFDAIAQGDGPVLADSLYRFVDRDGAALALRPDMTIPIARMVATRYQPEDMPLRLYYVGNVFRYAEPQAGRYREFTQVGVELIGAAGPRADAEVVAVAAGVLESLGLASFRLDLGHVGYLRGLVEAVPDGRVGDGLKEALLRRDYVRYEALVNQCGLDASRRQALLALPRLRGKGDVLEEARRLARGSRAALEALDNLSAIYELVTLYGLEERVGIDLAMTKDIDYYSGLLIEGYAPELGFTLGSGGRYDTLVGRFGQDFAATGFAFGVERAMLVLDRLGVTEAGPPPPQLL